MGYTIWPDGATGEVVEEVYKERQRQDRLVREGKFAWTCAATSQSDTRKLAVLAEEFGEVAKEVTEGIIALDKACTSSELAGITSKLRKELIQVAAVCVAWAESLSK